MTAVPPTPITAQLLYQPRELGAETARLDGYQEIAQTHATMPNSANKSFTKLTTWASSQPTEPHFVQSFLRAGIR